MCYYISKISVGDKKIRKLEIIMFYLAFISFVTAFWAILFRLLCPSFIIHITIAVFITILILSLILITKCFIEIDNEDNIIIEDLEITP